MDISEISGIIYGLIRKSEKKEVNWFHTADIDPRIPNEADDYTVNLEKSSINIFKYQVEDQENIGVIIMNERGKNILDIRIAPGELWYSDIDKLISLAKNKVDNIDGTLQSIKDELDSTGEIGQTIKDDEIPF